MNMEVEIYRSIGNEVVLTVEDIDKNRTYLFLLNEGIERIYKYDGSFTEGHYSDLGQELLRLFELQEKSK